MTTKLKEVREINGLELDQEKVEPTIGRNFMTKFEIQNEYSENILILEKDFILSDRNSAICITANMSFKLQRVPKRGDSVHTETRIGMNDVISSFSFTGS